MLAQFERARTLHLRGYTAEALRDYTGLFETYPEMPRTCRAALEFYIGYVHLQERSDADEAAKHFKRLRESERGDTAFGRMAADMMLELDG